MALKDTFNNISVISVEETGVPGENNSWKCYGKTVLLEIEDILLHCKINHI
jgi:hypothetical protein